MTTVYSRHYTRNQLPTDRTEQTHNNCKTTESRTGNSDWKFKFIVDSSVLKLRQ